MIPYWFLFGFPSALAVMSGPQLRRADDQRRWVLFFGLFVAVLIGFRWNVGGDWGWEHHFFQLTRDRDINYALRLIDPFFGFVFWAVSDSGYNVWCFNLVASLVFAAGLITFCRNEPHPWLTFAVAVPYLIIVVAMGYTRQAAALAMFMIALVSLSNGRTMRAVVFILIAATMHKTAVLLLPLCIVGTRINKIGALAIIAPVFFIAYTYTLDDHVDVMVKNYITAKYTSGGTLIRLVMNAIPAVIFLALRKKFPFNPAERAIVTVFSVAALLFLPVYSVFSASTTAVDRLALYIIPLQLYVFGRLPMALANDQSSYRAVSAAVLGYYGAVMLAWLNFADTAFAWVPFQLFPLEELTGLSLGF